MVERLNRRALSIPLLTSMCLSALPALGFAQSPTHEHAIAQAYAAWVETVNAKDLEAWSSYLAPGAIFFPPDSPALSSRSAILDFYSELFQDSRFALDCRLEKVEVATAEDMAWAHGYCESSFTGPIGLVAYASTKWVKVWKRQPGGEWKCAVNSWNATGSSPDEDSRAPSTDW
jgi:ketosteroid isomerase-like protein